MPEKGILSKLFGRKQDPRESFSSSLEELPSVLAEVRNEPNTDFQNSSDTNISDILKTIMSPSLDNLNLDSPEYMEQREKMTMGMQMGGMMPGGVSNALPYNMGGPVMKYNMGGSIGQQPLSYQLGGLLKYKRNPMVG
jgi:hypothetical protein